MSQGAEEKRIYPRVEYKVPVRCQVRGAQEALNTLADNISAGGLRFTDYHYLAPNTYLNLEVGVLSRFFNAVGKIAWTQHLPHTNQYRMGVSFQEIDLRSREYLQDFVSLHHAE